MMTRKIIVVPCIVKSSLYVAARDEVLVRIVELRADDPGLDSANQEPEE